MILPIQFRASRFNGCVNDIGKRNPLLLEPQFALRNARNVEKIIEEQGHMRHLPLNDRLCPLQLSRR